MLDGSVPWNLPFIKSGLASDYSIYYLLNLSSYGAYMCLFNDDDLSTSILIKINSSSSALVTTNNLSVFGISNNTSDNIPITFANNLSINLNTYYNIVIVSKCYNISVYIDGTLWFTFAPPNVDLFTSINIGPINGSIGYFTIFNKGLIQSEVSTLDTNWISNLSDPNTPIALDTISDPMVCT